MDLPFAMPGLDVSLFRWKILDEADGNQFRERRFQLHFQLRRQILFGKPHMPTCEGLQIKLQRRCGMELLIEETVNLFGSGNR